MDPGYIRDKDLDEAADHGEKLLTWMEESEDAITEIVGLGEGLSGRVKAKVGPDGRVLEVTYDPRAMKQDSQSLADETLVAVRAARQHAEQQTNDLMREALPGFDPEEAQSQLEQLLKGQWL
ncbi:YbaB/EbfC family nucleoid-associated protein [Nonomuraea sp. CA-143628]|uniref:YbaB/EbfC family nucleoid-associated protein n=1 Tax=Nonomuraea sp. CA-143628 TaxID=3239997 RepID=UPI003D8DC91A